MKTTRYLPLIRNTLISLYISFSLALIIFFKICLFSLNIEEEKSKKLKKNKKQKTKIHRANINTFSKFYA
jgi:hypothetical protein